MASNSRQRLPSQLPKHPVRGGPSNYRQRAVESGYASPIPPQDQRNPNNTTETTPSTRGKGRTSATIDMTIIDSSPEPEPEEEVQPGAKSATKCLRQSQIRCPRGKIFRKAKASYLAVYTRQVSATSGFDIPLNAVELSLRGIRDKLTSVTTQLELMNLHTRDGRAALKKAQDLLEKEWQRGKEMLKVFKKPDERREFEERFIEFKAGRSDQCDEDVRFCDALMEDLRELREEGLGRLRDSNAARAVGAA